MTDRRVPDGPSAEAWGYLPDEALVRATVDAGRCLTEPFAGSAAARLHLASCAACQRMVEADTVARHSAASAYVPAELLVARVLGASAVRRLRLPPSLQAPRSAVLDRRRPIARAVAALLGATGVSPAVLAAAVVVHAAMVSVVGGGIWRVTLPAAASLRAARPLTQIQERIAYVTLPAPAARVTRSLAASRAEKTRELRAALDQELPVAVGAPRVTPADSGRLEEVTAILRRFPTVRVRIESDAGIDARRQADAVRQFLVARGVAGARVAVAAGAWRGGVRVALDTIGDLVP
jgi:hypothetical protein